MVVTVVAAAAAGKPQSRPLDLVPGGIPQEGYQLTTEVTSDHLTLALDRLQRDMNSALVRLQAMETLFMAQKEVRLKTNFQNNFPDNFLTHILRKKCTVWTL